MKSRISGTGLQRNLLAQSLALVLGMQFAGSLMAQEATKPDAAKEESKELEEVRVIGSRIKRSEIEGPSPVTVITAEQIEREGFNTVYDALETLAQNTGFGQNDFNAAGGFTPNASVINLRGMGPGRTLLLVNGRRANDYPFPYNGRSNFQNFNNIPAAAVQRIEVLAGGASAIYGSDAIAGVINVVLKESFEGQSLQVKAQTSDQGGREIYDAQFVGGVSGDAWNVVYALEAFKGSPLFAYERDSMDSGADNPAPPGVNGASGVGGYQPPIGIQIRRQSNTGATVSYVQAAGFDCSGSGFYRPHTYTSATSGALLGPGCGYDRFVAEQTIANGNKDLSAYIQGSYNFDNGMKLWSSLSAFNSQGRLGGGVEQWQGGPQPGAAFYDPQFGFRIFPIRAITTEAYGGSEGTFQKFDETSYDFAVGLSGTIAEKFDWDVTVSHAEYHAKRERPRLTVAGATNYFMGPRLGTTGQGAYIIPGVSAGLPVYNLNLAHFYGVITPADYASMATLVKYDGKSENSAVTFTLSGELFDLPAGPLAFAAVVEASEQSYDLVTDPRIFPSVREVYNLTGTGGGGDRSRYAAGFELSVPIFDSLKMSVAGRFDKYDDITAVDDAKTWGVGLEWRPFETLLVRANYATSFKAPDMHYVFSERSGAFGTVTDFARCNRDGIASNLCGAAGANYNYSAFTTSQGNPGLQEETGDSWSGGFVWDIVQDLSLTVDYYKIRLNDEVTVQAGTTILQDEYGCATGNYPATVNQGGPFPYAAGSEYCLNIASLISRDPLNDGRLTEIRSGPINIAYRAVKGIDANLKYRWETGKFGTFNASLAWSHILGQESQAREGVQVISYRDLNSNADFRSRVRATISWAKDDWDATVFMNRQGSFPLWNLANYGFTGTPVTPATNPPTFQNDAYLTNRTQPYITYNMTVGYRFTDAFSMRFSVNNVFDNVGNFDPTFNSYPYTWQGYDLIGRSYGLQANYNF